MFATLATADFWLMMGRGLLETFYMVVVSTLLAYLIGLPLGLVLAVTDSEGLRPSPVLNKVLGTIVNLLRSVPFLIMVFLLNGLTLLIVGTTVGSTAMIVGLVVAAFPFVARLAEGSAREVDRGILEASVSMGASTWQIITKVILPECKPSLINGATVATTTILGYSAMAATIGGGGLATGVSTLAKLLNPNVKVIGVEPTGAASMKASLEAGHVVTLPTASTIADGVAVKTPGDLVFPYVQQNVDRVLALEDGELVEAFLDIMERHKMIVENAGLLTVAALKHLDCKGKNVVSVLSGGNMDVITMSSLVQHGLIGRGRIFTFAVQLPARPGELMRVADVLARNNGNIIKLEHNQFVNINRQSGVELRVTLEAFGHDHKKQILQAMRDEGYQVAERDTGDLY